MILLDTMVISELVKRQRHPKVAAWLAAQPADRLFLSAITIGEVERGIAKLEAGDAARAGALTAWLANVVAAFGARILPVDLAIARRWGRLSGMLGRADPDLIIAATALERRFAVATRNRKHFAATSVQLIDPWTA